MTEESKDLEATGKRGDPAEPPDPKYLLPGRVYDILKWVSLTAVPALSALMSTLGSVWGWSWASPAAATISAVGLCAGALIGISQATKS